MAGKHPEPTARYIRALGGYAFVAPGSGYLRASPEAEGQAVPPFAAELVLNATALEPLQAQAAAYASGIEGFLERRRFAQAVGAFGGSPSGSGDALEKALTGAMAELAARGHLQSATELAAALKKLPQPAVPKITSFVIPTANRPQGLERALESYLANFQKHGHAVRVVVGDDSADPSPNREVVARIAAKYAVKIDHVDRAGREKLLEERAGGNAEKRAALAFLLQGEPGLGPTIGMNRNALLLASAGELIFSADDDTVCNLFAPRNPAAGVGFLAPGEPAQAFSRWPTRDDAKAQLAPVDRDLLGAHARALGRSPAAILADVLSDDPGGALWGVDGDVHAALSTNQGQVAITVNGLVGDSGNSLTPLLSMLEARGPEASRIFGSAEAHARSREVVKLSSELRIGAQAAFMSTFFGLDNRSVVPYFPYFRRTDDLCYRELLLRCRPGATLAYLPLALEHAPLDTPKRDLPLVAMSDVLLAAMVDLPRAAPAGSPADLTRAAGHRLVAFAEQPHASYRRQVLEVVLEGRFKLLQLRKEARAMFAGQLPAALAEEAQRAELELERALAGPLVAADPALQAGRSAQEAEQRTRELVAGFGRALVALAG